MTQLQKNPKYAAEELHNSLGWTTPKDLSVVEIAYTLGLSIRDIPIKGSEGRILIKDNTGIISINSTIAHEGKRNFIIAHEIGHFILHKDILRLYSDTDKTLSEWHTKGPHEAEANRFASELLMPEIIFKQKVLNKKLNIKLIEEVSQYFNASLLATFLRYVNLGSYPVMIIFMKNGIVKWKQCSEDFPFKFLPYNSKVPAWTVAGDFFNKGKVESQPEKVDAIEWFPEDSQIKYKKDWKLWEQSYQIAENELVSCLWTY